MVFVVDSITAVLADSAAAWPSFVGIAASVAFEAFVASAYTAGASP